MNLITIRTFADPIQASMVNAVLINQGINSTLKDEHLVTMDPLFTNAIGGIKLQVLEEETEMALNILRDMDNKPLVDENGKTIVCPLCESVKISSMRKPPATAIGVIASILSLVLLVFPFFFKRIWYCRECKHEFYPES